MDAQYDTARSILENNSVTLKQGSELLLAEETIAGENLQALLEKNHSKKETG